MLYLLWGLSFGVSCAFKPNRTTQAISSEAMERTILIYGSSKCGYCTAVCAALDKEQIPYIFMNVINNKANKEEMSAKVLSTLPENTTSFTMLFPVVDANGIIFMREGQGHDAIENMVNRIKENQ